LRRARRPCGLAAIRTGTELGAPRAKLLEAAMGAGPPGDAAFVGVLAPSLLLGSGDETREDPIKAFAVDEAFEKLLGAVVHG